MNKVIIIVLAFVALIIVGPYILLGFGYIFHPSPPKSIIQFTINGHKKVWESSGFEGVGDLRDIQFFSSEDETVFDCDSLIIWIKEPVTVKTYNEENVVIELIQNNEQGSSTIITSERNQGKLTLVLNRWSEEPRGKIEGDIDAFLLNEKGEGFILKGSFKAYQAIGTMNNFH